MNFRKIYLIIWYFLLVIPFIQTNAMDEKHGRPYNIGHDIGFRWRTTLNIRCGDVQINSDAEHSRLKEVVEHCDSVLTAGKSNVIAASLQVVFRDSASESIPIKAEVYTKDLAGTPQGTRIDCFSTACLSVEVDSDTRHPPITYRNRETLDLSIPFIFQAIGMNDSCIKSKSADRFKYNYRDTEFQLIHELFSTEEHRFVPGKARGQRGKFQAAKRNPRFMELLRAILGGRSINDLALIILHIHTNFDPCSVCAEMLCNLSETLNYLPEKLIEDPELSSQLKDHNTQFLIEVSPDAPYWNSGEAGLDEFYMLQLSDINGFGVHPVEILDPGKFLSTPSMLSYTAIISNIVTNMPPFSYFPPFVVFKRMNPPVIFKSLKMDRKKSISDVSPEIPEIQK